MDTSFAHTFGPCPGMSGIGVQSDGKILVGGICPAGQRLSRQYLLPAALNADGTVDTTYPMRSAPGGFVRAAQVYPATDPTYPNCVRLFGTIPRFSDPTHLDYMLLLRSNGTTVLSSIGDEIVNGAILQMWIQGDGKIVIVGTFDPGLWRHHEWRRPPALPTGGLDPDF